MRAITEATVDFGAADVPLPPVELERRNLFQFPTLVGGIVTIVNLPGVSNGELRLDAATLARIWAAESHAGTNPIATLNPGLTLPALPIQRVVRSDGSGTTNVFVNHLRSAAPPEGADGSSKLVAAVKATPGAIGYASSHYFLRDQFSSVTQRTPRGEWVQPTQPALRAANRHLFAGAARNCVAGTRHAHTQLLPSVRHALRPRRGRHRLCLTANRHPAPHRGPVVELQDHRRTARTGRWHADAACPHARSMTRVVPT